MDDLGKKKDYVYDCGYETYDIEACMETFIKQGQTIPDSSRL